MRAKPLIIISTAAAFRGYCCSNVGSSVISFTEVNNEAGTGASVHVPNAWKEERPSLAVGCENSSIWASGMGGQASLALSHTC